jgi:hypothetical protein
MFAYFFFQINTRSFRLFWIHTCVHSILFAMLCLKIFQIHLVCQLIIIVVVVGVLSNFICFTGVAAFFRFATCGIFEMGMTVVSWRSRNQDAQRNQVVSVSYKKKQCNAIQFFSFPLQ